MAEKGWGLGLLWEQNLQHLCFQGSVGGWSTQSPWVWASRTITPSLGHCPTLIPLPPPPTGLQSWECSGKPSETESWAWGLLLGEPNAARHYWVAG